MDQFINGKFIRYYAQLALTTGIFVRFTPNAYSFDMEFLVILNYYTDTPTRVDDLTDILKCPCTVNATQLRLNFNSDYPITKIPGDTIACK